MPLKECSENGKPGIKYGEQGACYTYTPNDVQSRARAKKKAIEQAIAIGEGNKLSE